MSIDEPVEETFTDSVPASIPELLLFSQAPTNVAVQASRYEIIETANPVGSEVAKLIVPKSEWYTDWSRTLLRVEQKIVQDDGSDVPETWEFTKADKSKEVVTVQVATANNALYSSFKNCKIYIGSKHVMS